MEAPAEGTPELDAGGEESALRAAVLSRVVAGVVHDVRNLLNTMLMRLQLLRDALSREAGLPEAVAGHLRVLDAQIERMTEMIRKVASTVDPPEPLGLVDAGALLADVAGALGYEARRRSIELAVEPQGAAIRTAAEPAGVGRLVLDLVGGAISATPDGGRLVARAGARDGAAVLELEHTGAAPAPGAGDGLDALAEPASALGGRLERGAGEGGRARLTLTLPGNERR